MLLLLPEQLACRQRLLASTYSGGWLSTCCVSARALLLVAGGSLLSHEDYVRESIKRHAWLLSYSFAFSPHTGTLIMCHALLHGLVTRNVLLLLCYAGRVLLQSRRNACLVGIMCGASEKIAFTSGVAHVKRRCDDRMCVVSVIGRLVARRMLGEKRRRDFLFFSFLSFFCFFFSFFPFFFFFLVARGTQEEARLEQKPWRLSLPHEHAVILRKATVVTWNP